jgi:serine/threonine protein phosphatase 1
LWNSLQRTRGVARVPDGLRIYAIGDVHGCAGLLDALLLQIDADCQRYPPSHALIVFLGDYIDRGPASKEVLDLLLKCQRTHEAVFLKGNHETFVDRFLDDPSILEEWRLCGGLETLMSYGLKPSLSPSADEQAMLAEEFGRLIPKQHLQFLESLDLSFTCGDFLFVHAGIRPDVPLRKQKEDDLLWIRDEFLCWERRFEKIIVHGHTPVPALDIRSNRINIDTGAFATGRLTCVIIEGSAIVPLIDVRDWTRKSIMNRHTQTRMKPASQTQPVNFFTR